MEFTRFIAELLRQSNEVSIPGLGTFFKERLDGYYNKLDCTFIPPKEKLSFKTDSSESLQLTNYISRQKGISVSSVSYFLDKFVTDLQDQLETSKYFDFKPLGILRKEKDEYSFENSDKLDFQESFYGLKPLSELDENSAPINKEIYQTEPNLEAIIPNEGVKLEEDIILAPADKEIEEVEDNSNTPSLLHKLVIKEEVEELEGPEETQGFKILRNAAMVVAVAGVAFIMISYFFYPNAYKLLFEPETVFDKIIAPEKKVVPLPFPKSLLDSMASADSTVNALQLEDSILNDKVDSTQRALATIKQDPVRLEETPKNTPTKIPVETIIAGQPTYEIITASLNKLADTTKIIKNFKKMGIHATAIIAPEKRKNNILISIGSFNTNKGAEAELIHVKKKIEKDAYIYKKKF